MSKYIVRQRTTVAFDDIKTEVEAEKFTTGIYNGEMTAEFTDANDQKVAAFNFVVSIQKID